MYVCRWRFLQGEACCHGLISIIDETHEIDDNLTYPEGAEDNDTFVDSFLYGDDGAAVEKAAPHTFVEGEAGMEGRLALDQYVEDTIQMMGQHVEALSHLDQL